MYHFNSFHIKNICIMKTKLFIGLLSIFLLSGCSNFLNLSPISSANENSYYQSKADFESAMNAVYATLYTIYGPQSLPSYYGELSSDNVYCNETAGDYTAKIALSTHQNIITSNSVVEDFWNTYYEALFKINNVISKLNSADFSTKNQIEGECRFLRALYYFDMVRAWGDVPLVLSPISIPEAYAQGRTPASEIYKAIIEDLKYAADNLPGKSGERIAGAATSDAANTLLGKVYLTLGEKDNAATFLKKEYGKFSLEPNYANLWNLNNKNCKESIFEIQYLGGKNNPYSKYWALFTPLDNRCITAWGMGVNQVSDDLWNAFENGDPRRDATVQNGYQNTNGDLVPTKFCVKWRDDNAKLDGLTEAANNNFIVLRYADVLLMLTEATGDVKYMNEVRARAGLPGYGESGYPSSAYPTVKAALQHEYQVEFGCEFHRWFDLKRLGTAIDVMKHSSKNVTLTEDQLYLPIPQSVIDQNPNVITQNKAYK